MKKIILIVAFASCNSKEIVKTNNQDHKPETYCSLISEYQFNVDQTGYDIMNEYGQVIGRLNYGDNPTLDSLINFDNQ